MKTNVLILGSTGSIGKQALDVIRANSDIFNVIGLCADTNYELMEQQIAEFNPKYAYLANKEANSILAKNDFKHTKLLTAENAIEQCIEDSETNIVLNAIVGFAGLRPLLHALKMNKDVALANKESLVAGGFLVMDVLAKSRATIIPVDSEHNSIYQCLNSRPSEIPERIILTASGGPFHNRSLEDLKDITPEEAVKHPNWSMGAKISIDSATLMNKCLEVIEAAVLFRLPPEKIEVLIHPQSIVHGLVDYKDGSTIAVLYNPDMKVPIANAFFTLAKHHNIVQNNPITRLNFSDISQLSFIKPDVDRHRALRLSYEVIKKGYAAHITLNAANEVAVNNFLKRRVSFINIVKVVEMTLEKLNEVAVESMEDIYKIDRWARDCATTIIESKTDED
ncbi:MAG: 1-deoxy-D-xylulose-5-phosphate reductoisomerase [Proteobacteria bacterium]|nr:1-deoxy-D-xylulose-5-phosphate reductoisomerase [Pseudomonadota bacterium]